MEYFVYLVECSDGSFYCGYSNDLKRRLKEHNSSKNGALYTKLRRPVKLIYTEEYLTISEAMKRECEIKKLKRKQKEKLIDTFFKQKGKRDGIETKTDKD